ncbi:MAG: Rrf2 family transcriptional regulator [bacterium]|nr:Rrf2 family transcriptional regulator [bacterium]
MKLSTRARYALRLMVDLAVQGNEDESVSLATVAGRTGLSRGYLEQLALTLRNARLVRSSAGRKGGYRLARPASKITIGEIVEASIGPICVVDCVDDPESCMRTDYCECRLVYALINKKVAEVLHAYSLGDLTDPDWIHTIQDQIDGTQLPTYSGKS